MSDKIEEIRKRHEAGPIGHLPIAAFSLAHDDRATLLAEVKRLRAALQYMVNVCPAIDPNGELAHELARNALEAKP